MDDTSADGQYQPGEVAERLFFTTADGSETDPDSAIAIAADDQGWVPLEPDAQALLADESAEPYDRYLAMTALARWGSPVGYAAVQAAAQDPDGQPWRDYSIDRFYSLDNTFALLSLAVINSVDQAEERGTVAEKRAAIAALIGITDRVYFEHDLSASTMYPEDVEQLREVIEAQIEKGIAEVAAATDDFPLPAWVHDQVRELIDALGLVDKGAAAAYLARLGD
ncbi:MAG TPA: hypothetical protein VL551_21125 [Actinospica sp.]|jgi:hypothetical protein|nr:hypothetical protein [Actinospica sp.]